MKNEKSPVQTQSILFLKEEQSLSQENFFVEETNTALVITKTSNFNAVERLNSERIRAIVIDSSNQKEVESITNKIATSHPHLPVFVFNTDENLKISTAKTIVLNKSTHDLKKLYATVSAYIQKNSYLYVKDYAGKTVIGNKIIFEQLDNAQQQATFAFQMKKLLNTENTEIANWTASLVKTITNKCDNIQIKRLVFKEKSEIIVAFAFQINGKDKEELYEKYHNVFPLISYFMNDKSLTNPAHFEAVTHHDRLTNIRDYIVNGKQLKSYIFKPESIAVSPRKSVNGYHNSNTNKQENIIEIPAVKLATDNQYDNLFRLLNLIDGNCLISNISPYQLNEAQKQALAQAPQQLRSLNLSQEAYSRYMLQIDRLVNAEKVYKVTHILLDSGNISEIITQEISKKLFDNQNSIINQQELSNALDSAFLQSIEDISLSHMIPVISKSISNSYKIINKQEKLINPLFLDNKGIMIGQHFLGKVYLDPKQFQKHSYLLGKTGTGKTSMLYTMIMHQISQGKGIALIDPHGDIYKAVLQNLPANRRKDLITFDPTDPENTFGFNMLRYDRNFPQQQNFIIDQFFEFFNEIYDMKHAGGPMFEQLFTNALKLIMDVNKNAVLTDLGKFFFDGGYRLFIMKATKDKSAKRIIENALEMTGDQSFKNWAPYITSKVNRIVENSYIRESTCNPVRNFNFRRMIDTNKIFLVKLNKGKMGGEAVKFLGRLLTNQIIMAAYSRENVPEECRKDFSLFIDEFQNFTGKNIISALSETRKYRLQLILANQTFDQLDERIVNNILGNVGSIITAAVSPKDAGKITPFFEPFFSKEDIVQLDNYKFIVSSMYNNLFVKPFITTSIPY